MLEMSTRDPIWMTPLVKSLFRVKSRISLNNEERLRLINNRISEVISENRKNPWIMIGSQRWWENVDSISQRRNSSQISLNPDSLDRLNDHFAQICYDDNYIPPSDVTIGHGVEIPKMLENYVWNILSRIKDTTTGPDMLPFWVWRDHSEILTPVITHIWNLSLSTLSWPSSWKRANINPLLHKETLLLRTHTFVALI